MILKLPECPCVRRKRSRKRRSGCRSGSNICRRASHRFCRGKMLNCTGTVGRNCCKKSRKIVLKTPGSVLHCWKPCFSHRIMHWALKQTRKEIRSLPKNMLLCKRGSAGITGQKEMPGQKPSLKASLITQRGMSAGCASAIKKYCLN